MNADLTWTEDLGNAVIDQQDDVMDMIQQVRAEASAAGYLKSDEKQVVVQEEETIIIQPANPEVIYVPDYDPQVVYVQSYASYPPYYYYSTPYPYYYSPAAAFWTGAFIGAAFSYGFNWGGGDIDINYGSATDCCRGGNINTGDINIGNQVDHHTGDRFNADQQRVNGGDKMKWNGNKARQKQATGKQRAARNKAGTLPASSQRATKGTKQAGGAANKGQNRAGDRKSSNFKNPALGNPSSKRDATKSRNQGSKSMQNRNQRSGGSQQRATQNRNRSQAGAFGGYGSGSKASRSSSRGSTIDNLHAYVDAQVQYASEDRDGDDVLEYAQKINSTAGKKDGLYWETAAGSDEELSSFGPFFGEHSAYLHGRGQGDPFMGYFYRIVSRQGENAPGGRYDYVINGNMIAGFAMIAWPAEYGSSGIMTFVVSQNGKVFQTDLGDLTEGAAAAIQVYDPDDSWTLVTE